MEEEQLTSTQDVSPVSSTSQVQEEEFNGNRNVNEPDPHNHDQHQHQLPTITSFYSTNALTPDTPLTWITDDVWSCLVVLLTFWFFASMTSILGLYGSENLQLGPNYSRLIKVNPFFVQSIKVEEIGEPKFGPVLYKFHTPPPLDVKMTWNDTHNALIPGNFRKEWSYFLNEGSELNIFYDVKSPNSLHLPLVIAKGRDNLEEWIEDPSFHATTSWNIIHGSGIIKQRIPSSFNYYIAVGNFNSEDAEVEMKFTINAFTYNTTSAYNKCFLHSGLCDLTLLLIESSTAVLTTPGSKEGTPDSGEYYVKLSYGPRWIIYIMASGILTVLILVCFRFCNSCQNTSGEGGTGLFPQMGAMQAPLLANKDDVSSLGSSYESLSQGEEDELERLAVNSMEGKLLTDATDITSFRRLCVICFDAPRECFFLPCGHCATCFPCGTRIAEEAGSCPICRRTLKKVRKVITV